MKCGSCGHDVSKYRCFRDKEGHELVVCHPCIRSVTSAGPMIIVRDRSTGDQWHIHVQLVLIGREKGNSDVNVRAPVGVQ